MAEQVEQGKAAAEKPRRKRFFLEFLGWAAAIFAIVFFAPLLIHEWKLLIGSKEEVGVFGDQFGAVNALFSGLAFAGVIVAMRMQSRELQLQQRELADTRAVMTDQKKQLELQAFSMQKQTFENTFFQMMSLYHQIVEGIVSQGMNRDTFGKAAISIYRSSYSAGFQQAASKPYPSAPSFQDQPAPFKLRLHDVHHQRWHTDNSDEFGHYFRHIFKVVEFVDKQSNEKNKRFYVEVLTSQFSQSELVLIFYNTISEVSPDDALKLYLRHDLFGSLEPEQLLRKSDWDLLRYAATLEEIHEDLSRSDERPQ